MNEQCPRCKSKDSSFICKYRLGEVYIMVHECNICHNHWEKIFDERREEDDK